MAACECDVFHPFHREGPYTLYSLFSCGPSLYRISGGGPVMELFDHAQELRSIRQKASNGLQTTDLGARDNQIALPDDVLVYTFTEYFCIRELSTLLKVNCGFRYALGLTNLIVSGIASVLSDMCNGYRSVSHCSGPAWVELRTRSLFR